MNNAIVCGAGAAGLAAAATLARAGVDVVVLEQSDRVATSWRNRYDGLRLNTPGWMSTLPGYRARRREYGEYPTRDEWVRYLEEYTAHHQIHVQFGTVARKLVRSAEGWVVETTSGDLTAKIVVVATGHDREPVLPDWPGLNDYSRPVIHSSSYRNPDDYQGLDVLVVGPNTTGSELANYLVKGGARRVRLACRTTPNLASRKFLGVSVNIPGIALNYVPLRAADRVGRLTQRIMFGNLDRFGLPMPPEGVATTLSKRHKGAAIDDGFVAELKAGRIEIVGAVIGFDGDDVLLAGGTRIRPDAVIAATGYRRGLEPLVGHLDVLDPRGLPLISGGKQHPSAPGLFFNGYRTDLSGQLRLMRIDARMIATAVKHLRID